MSCNRLVEAGFEELLAFRLGGCQLGFEGVADGHQFVHSGDDALLFGCRSYWDNHTLQLRPIYVCLAALLLQLWVNLRLSEIGRIHR